MANQSLDEQRLTALREDLGLDGLVMSSPNNTQYWTGCLILTQRLLPERLALVVSSASGSAFVVCDIEERQARTESRIKAVHGYTEFGTSPIASAVELLQERGISEGRIGFEGHHLVAQYYQELREGLPRADLIPVDGELDRLRALKTPEEIHLLRQAFEATDRAIAHSFETAEPGVSTRHIASVLGDGLRQGGADEVRFLVIGAGTDTLSGHPEATDEDTRHGDALRVDVGGSFRGYHSDLARTAFVGGAQDDQLESYRRLYQALNDLIAEVRPGLPAAEVYATGQRTMAANGLKLNEAGGRWELPHVGHGIGLAIHEFPMLQASQPQALEPGMVLCLELLYTEPGRYRMHLEDAVVVTDEGAEVLSRTRDWQEPPII